MKKAFLLKSTSLLVVLFAAVTLFFTSANTEKQAEKQAIVELSAKVAQLNNELTTLSVDKTRGSSVGGDPFIGEIIMFGGNYAPRDWALCNGQLLPINQHSALFSILGTTYGGDGRTTFGLPDLRGRVAVHSGSGPGLNNIRLGQKGGREMTTLTMANMPSHNHGMSTFKAQLDAGGDNKDVFVEDNGNGSSQTGNSGGSQAFDNRDPYIGVNYIISLGGVFPSRS